MEISHVATQCFCNKQPEILDQYHTPGLLILFQYHSVMNYRSLINRVVINISSRAAKKFDELARVLSRLIERKSVIYFALQ